MMGHFRIFAQIPIPDGQPVTQIWKNSAKESLGQGYRPINARNPNSWVCEKTAEVRLSLHPLIR